LYKPYRILCALALVGSGALHASTVLDIGVAGAFPSACTPGCTATLQQVYNKSLFSAPMNIDGIQLYGLSLPVNSVFTITLSATSKGVLGLDDTFANNSGSDALLFYSGPLTTSGGKTLITGTPFHYNPLQGNLLLQIDNSNPGSASFTTLYNGPAISGLSGAMSTLWSSIEAPTGVWSANGLATTFIDSGAATPEPASAALILSGFLMLGVPASKRFLRSRR
jgi:hypothetical protein